MQTFWRWWVFVFPKQTSHLANLPTINPHGLVFSVLLQKCTSVLTTVLSTIKCHVWSLCYINAQFHVQSCTTTCQQTNKQTNKQKEKQITDKLQTKGFLYCYINAFSTCCSMCSLPIACQPDPSTIKFLFSRMKPCSNLLRNKSPRKVCLFGMKDLSYPELPHPFKRRPQGWLISQK